MNGRDDIQRIAEAIVDGTATDADRARLAALLAESPASREVWADLEAARGALAHAGLDSPPPDLQESILRVVAEAPRPEPVVPAWWRAIAESFQLRPASRLAWGLAALLAVTVIGVALVTGQFGNGRRLAPSTVATLSPEGESDADPPPGGGGGTPSPGPRVEATAVREAQGIRVEVHARGDAEVSVTWDPDAARVTGFRWTAGGGDAPSLEPGRVLAHVGHEGTFVFSLSPTGAADPELQLRLRSGDREEVRKLVISAR